MCLRRLSQRGLTFLKQHVILVLWLFFICTVFWTSYSKYKKEPKYFYVRQIIGSGLCLSRGTASVLNVSCFMVVLSMCRTLTTFVRTISARLSAKFLCAWVDTSKKFHTICAATVLIAGVVHSLAHFVNSLNFSRHYNSNYNDVNMAEFKGEDPLMIIFNVPGITGVLMLVILFILSSSSVKYVRNISYDIFWVTHRLFLIFLLLLFCHPLSGMLKEQNNIHVHPPGCQFINANYTHDNIIFKNCLEQPVFVPDKTDTWKWVFGALLACMVDFVCRLFNRKTTAHILTVQAHQCYLLKLKLLKENFAAQPGQFVYLHCPAISTIEWHPFTISKCPSNKDPSFTVHLRTKGDWSRSLHRILFTEIYTMNQVKIDFDNFCFKASSVDRLKTNLVVDGPFTSCMENVLHFSVSICVAGGIGFTPFASFLNILREYPCNLGKVKRLHLLWICKEIEDFCCFSNLLLEVFHLAWNSNKPDMLEFNLYLTQHHSWTKIKMALKDKFSFMKPRIQFGHPKWFYLFQQWSEIYKKTNVGLFCCGPQSLHGEISETSRNPSFHNCSFSYYHDSFS